MQGERHAEAGACVKGNRVLIVEDEVLVAMLLEDELIEAGAEVLGPVSSVGAALRLIEMAAMDGGLSAAVLDVNLRGECVSPVADRLAALGVPFVFATGYRRGNHIDGHKVAPVFEKPFIPAALVAAVAALAPPPWKQTAGGGEPD